MVTKFYSYERLIAKNSDDNKRHISLNHLFSNGLSKTLNVETFISLVTGVNSVDDIQHQRGNEKQLPFATVGLDVLHKIS